MVFCENFECKIRSHENWTNLISYLKHKHHSSMIFVNPCVFPQNIIFFVKSPPAKPLFSLESISLSFLRCLPSENIIFAAWKHVIKFDTERGHLKLKLDNQGPLKILIRKWRGHEKFLSSRKHLSAPYPALIMTDPSWHRPCSVVK